MDALRLLGLLGVWMVTGCASQTAAYLHQHPDLTAAHRHILLSGFVPNGDAVAGMSRQEVRLAMGRDPDTFDKINGEDAWIYLRNGASEEKPDEEKHGGSSLKKHRDSSKTKSSHAGSGKTLTIFFKGDRATRAAVGEQSSSDAESASPRL